MTEDTSIGLKTIGWIQADFKQKFGTPRQGSLARHSRASVKLAPEWLGRGIFSGLEGFSHVWVISFLHLSHTKRLRGKVHPPRLRGRKIGVMGSRSPHRPNNIGLTLARIVRCEGDYLELTEVDLVEGTPILDLKPYLAEADRPETFTSGWTSAVEYQPRLCEFTDQALADLQRQSVGEPKRLRDLITEMLSLDPRPPAYLGRDVADFAVWVAGLNVKFQFANEKFTVTAIEKV
jgi:tRNA-Thr(GGU) m(6)t(6)A37 methyltransferase TsaA